MSETQTFDEIQNDQEMHDAIYNAVLAFEETLADGDWAYRTQGPYADWWYVIARRTIGDDLDIVARMRQKKGEQEKQVSYTVMGRNLDHLPLCEGSYRGTDLRAGLEQARSEFWSGNELTAAIVHQQARLSALAAEAQTQNEAST